MGPDLPIQIPSKFIWAISKDYVDRKKTVIFHEITLGGHIKTLNENKLKEAIFRDREWRGHLGTKEGFGLEEIMKAN